MVPELRTPGRIWLLEQAGELEEQKLVPKMLIMSPCAMFCVCPGFTSWKDEALATPWMMGPLPMESAMVALGTVQVGWPCGLQTPRMTVPPAAKFRYVSPVAGVRVRIMLEALVTLTAMLVSWIRTLLETTPTLVF